MHISRTLLRYLTLSAIIATALAGSTVPAFASAGCTAINNGAANVNQTLGTSSNVTSIVHTFDVGDRISYTISSGHNYQYAIFDAYGYPLAQLYYPSNGAAGTVLVANSAQAILLQILVQGGGQQTTVTVTCTPAAVGSSNTVRDSDKAQAVQAIGSRMVARNSVSAISAASQYAANAQNIMAASTSSGLGGPRPPSGPDDRSDLGREDGTLPPLPRSQIAIGNFVLWSDVRATGILDSDGGAAGFRGQQVNVTSGVGLRLNANTVVGAIAAFEHFNYDFASLNGNLRGDGYTGGMYFATKLSPDSWFNLTGTYTRLNYDLGAGTAAGSFDGDRWMVSGTFGTRVTLPIRQMFAEPTVGLMYMRELQSAWADSIGGAHAARSFDEGRFSAGTKIGTTWALPTAVLTPYVGAYADYYFGSTDGLPTGIDGIGLNHNWSMRAVAGIDAQVDKGTSLNLGATLGGIGDNYQTLSVRGGYSVRF